MQLPFQQPFDARQVPPQEAQQPVPAGEYKVVIAESEVAPTAKGDAGMLVLKLQIIEGQYTHRMLKYFLNLWNPSQQATAIAQSQFSAICHVTGVFAPVDSQQLHGIPFIAVVTINSSGYNDVKGVKHLDGSQPGKGGSNTGSAMPSAPAPAAAPGWGTAPPIPQQPAPAAYQQPAAPAAPAAWGPPQPVAAPPPAYAPPTAPAPAWSPQPAVPAPQQQPAPAAPAWGSAPASAPPWANK